MNKSVIDKKVYSKSIYINKEDIDFLSTFNLPDCSRDIFNDMFCKALKFFRLDDYDYCTKKRRPIRAFSPLNRNNMALIMDKLNEEINMRENKKLEEAKENEGKKFQLKYKPLKNVDLLKFEKLYQQGFEKMRKLNQSLKSSTTRN